MCNHLYKFSHYTYYFEVSLTHNHDYTCIFSLLINSKRLATNCKTKNILSYTLKMRW